MLMVMAVVVATVVMFIGWSGMYIFSVLVLVVLHMSVSTIFGY